ncbi:hypothetical protein RND71_004684 [Anisodus tanguticus]|uniref:Uncharacterized protein n=1 Tax=Anisodus tanguticus TaxID=243964 RepID=A0AAE1SQ13_9SOLA|nr:hypothetical protein RND71_004684 [Anisodus tanguticus]
MAEEVILLDFRCSMYGMRARIALAEKSQENEPYSQENPSVDSQWEINLKLKHGSGLIIWTILAVFVYKVRAAERTPTLTICGPFSFSSLPGKGDQRKVACFSPNDGNIVQCREGDNVLRSGDLRGDGYGNPPQMGGEYKGDLTLCLNETECRKLISWVKRCLERDCISKALPDSEKVC